MNVNLGNLTIQLIGVLLNTEILNTRNMWVETATTLVPNPTVPRVFVWRCFFIYLPLLHPPTSHRLPITPSQTPHPLHIQIEYSFKTPDILEETNLKLTRSLELYRFLCQDPVKVTLSSVSG